MKSGAEKGKLWLIFLSILFLIFSSIFAKEKGPSVIVIRAGKIVPVSGPPIENGTIIIEEGKIKAVGKELFFPKEGDFIDCSNYQVFPGFIDALSNLGLQDLEPEEQDSSEPTIPITPQLRVIDALNPENRFMAKARKSGVTSALVAPVGCNVISGQSALINLAGSSLEEMIIKFPVAIYANLGEPPKIIFGKKGQTPSTRMGEVALLRQALIDAQDYEKRKAREPNKRDPKLEPLLLLLKREAPLIIQANRLSDILAALRVAEEFNLKLIISQGAEAHRIAELLSAKKIPVLLGPTGYYFQRVETRKATEEAASILNKAGLDIAFQTGDVRTGATILYQAQMAFKHDLDYEAALKGLTINPARIFGVDKEVGSIDEGKIANLVIFEGDPIVGIAKTKMVIIKGRVVEKL